MLDFYVWQIGSLPGQMSLRQICNQFGFNSVNVKLLNGLRKYNQTGGNDAYLRDVWFKSMWDHGIETWGWGWPFPLPTLSPGAQGDAVFERYQKFNLAGDNHSRLGRLVGWADDIEEYAKIGSFWKSGQYRYSSAKTYRGKFEPLANKIQVAMASYRYISAHQRCLGTNL